MFTKNLGRVKFLKFQEQLGFRILFTKMIDSDSLKALLAALSKGECRNNSDRPEHRSRCLDVVLRSGLQPLGFTCPVFHTDAL